MKDENLEFIAQLISWRVTCSHSSSWSESLPGRLIAVSSFKAVQFGLKSTSHSASFFFSRQFGFSEPLLVGSACLKVSLCSPYSYIWRRGLLILVSLMKLLSFLFPELNNFLCSIEYYFNPLSCVLSFLLGWRSCSEKIVM